MRSVDRARHGGPEDGAVLVVLILTVVFVMFMASVPLWFSGLIRSLAP